MARHRKLDLEPSSVKKLSLFQVHGMSHPSFPFVLVRREGHGCARPHFSEKLPPCSALLCQLCSGIRAFCRKGNCKAVAKQRAKCAVSFRVLSCIGQQKTEV